MVRLKNLGRFTEEIEAAKAYNDAIKKYSLTNKYKNIVRS
jgi:hypothetical protein